MYTFQVSYGSPMILTHSCRAVRIARYINTCSRTPRGQWTVPTQSAVTSTLRAASHNLVMTSSATNQVCSRMFHYLLDSFDKEIKASLAKPTLNFNGYSTSVHCWLLKLLSRSKPMLDSIQEVYKIFIMHVNSLRLRWNRCHSADDIFKCIFLNENVLILNDISLKFIPKGPINNILALI